MNKNEIIHLAMEKDIPHFSEKADGTDVLTITIAACHECMDQYAEQEAISFGEWLKKAAWSHSPYMTEPIVWRLTGNYLMLNPDTENKDYTSDGLYTLYKQTIKL